MCAHPGLSMDAKTDGTCLSQAAVASEMAAAARLVDSDATRRLSTGSIGSHIGSHTGSHHTLKTASTGSHHHLNASSIGSLHTLSASSCGARSLDSNYSVTSGALSMDSTLSTVEEETTRQGFRHTATDVFALAAPL